MPFFLARLLARITLLSSWATPVVVTVGVFVTSWPLMALAEPAGSELVQPGNYWWYFVVTAATVGYGDYSPETAWGHVVGAYVIVGGIATLTTVFTKLASVLEQTRGKRMQGHAEVKASDHVVVIGYTPGRTERIVEELLAEDGRAVVLCTSNDTATHPMPDSEVAFVRGEVTDDEVLRRAGVERAAAVLVDAGDDNEALAITLAVDHVRPELHVVVALRDMARASLVGYLGGHIRCVQWHTPRMITEELGSPGIAEVYADLMTHGGANTYSVTLPESLGTLSVEQCRTALGRTHGATLLAARANGRLLVNPPWQDELPPGTVVYYISQRRLTVDELTDVLR